MTDIFRCMKNCFIVREKNHLLLCETGRTINACIVRVSCRYLFKTCLKRVTHSFLVKTLPVCICTASWNCLWIVTERALWLTNGSWWPGIDQKIFPDYTLTRHFSTADRIYRAYHSSKLYFFVSKSGLIYFRVWGKEWHYQNDTFRRWFLVLLGVID